MKRVLAVLLLALSVLLTSVQQLSAQSIQQIEATDVSTLRYFTVVKGTTGWGVSKMVFGNGEMWIDSIFRPSLAKGLLKSTDTLTNAAGMKILLLQPGQILWLRSDAGQLAAGTLEETTPLPAPAPLASVTVVEKTPGWVWALLSLVVALIVACIYALKATSRMQRERDREAESRANDKHDRDLNSESERAQRVVLQEQLAEATRPRSPAETMSQVEIRAMTIAPLMLPASAPDGPAFIPGGIRTSENLGLALQRSAQLSYARGHFHDLPPHHSVFLFRNGTEERGIVVSGEYASYFSNGTLRQRVVRADDRDHPVVWRACVVNPDGSEHFVYTEEVCANGMVTPITGENFVWVAMPTGERLQRIPESMIAPEPVVPIYLGETPVLEEVPVAPQVAIFRTASGEELHVPIGSALIGIVPAENR